MVGPLVTIPPALLCCVIGVRVPPRWRIGVIGHVVSREFTSASNAVSVEEHLFRMAASLRDSQGRTGGPIPWKRCLDGLVRPRAAVAQVRCSGESIFVVAGV